MSVRRAMIDEDAGLPLMAVNDDDDTWAVSDTARIKQGGYLLMAQNKQGDYVPISCDKNGHIYVCDCDGTPYQTDAEGRMKIAIKLVEGVVAR